MGRYIVLGIAREPAEAEEQSVEVVQTQFPSWAPRDADPMTIALRGAAVLYAELAELTTRMGEEAFRYFGRSVAGLPPNDERAAVGTVTITAQDTDGPYLVPEGLEITGRGPLGEQVTFRTLAEATIPNGSASVSLDIEAAEAGEGSNGVSGAGEFSEYIDYLSTVVFDAPTSGGEDQEPDPEYLDRLSDEFGMFSPRPILPEHFATLARRYGAHRATAIDGLNATLNTTGHPATMTVAVVDEAGNPLPGADRTAISVALQAQREVGWDVFVIDPTYTTIAVTATVTAYPGYDPDAVEAVAVSQLESYLSPSQWGAGTDMAGGREWLNEPVVRYLEVAEQLQRVEGLRFVDTLTIGIEGGALGTANVALPGRAPLPRPGTITVTASPG